MKINVTKGKGNKPVDKPPMEKQVPAPISDYAVGYERGLKLGLTLSPGLADAKRIAFENGVRHIVTLAENILADEFNLPSREALAQSGKMPAWFITLLVREFVESRSEAGPTPKNNLVESEDTLSQNETDD